ncbi:CRAL-TRIO domain-containing protein [Paraphysoderma sedebokerense]|nr:CRAL-TRIO domain-containing protein [Paraphysoderma sedebokerense]
MKTIVPDTPAAQEFIAKARNDDTITQHELYNRLTDLDIYKFFVGHKLNEKNALEALKKTLDWRKTFNYYNLPNEEFADLEAIGKWYKSGSAKNGTSLFIWRTVLHKPCATDEQVQREFRFIMYVLSKGWFDGTTTDRITVVLDYFDTTFAHKDLALTKIAAVSLSQHFPEVLDEVILVPSNWLVSFLWNTVRLFLDPVTVAKIKLLGSSDAHKTLERIDAQYLPPSFAKTIEAAEFKKKSKSAMLEEEVFLDAEAPK